MTSQEKFEVGGDPFISVRVIADSIGISRLTTLELRFPRYIAEEILTHRLGITRSAPSSRAIPVKKMLDRANYTPNRWPANGKGMAPPKELDPEKILEARKIWDEAKEVAKKAAEELANLGVHKQVTNRLLHPFQHHTLVVTIEPDEPGMLGFFAQRLALREDGWPLAQWEFHELATKMRDALAKSKPDKVKLHKRGETWGTEHWHLPFIRAKASEFPGIDVGRAKRVSVARCARTSYAQHDGRIDVAKDLDLERRLAEDGHMAPYEHVCTPITSPNGWGQGPFKFWRCYRHTRQMKF